MSPVAHTIVLPSLVLLRRDRQTNSQTTAINDFCPFIRWLRTVNRCSAFIWCGLFSDTEPGECYTRGSNGVYYWTAGQRINPGHKSTFVWRVISTRPYVDTVSPMGYTNWNPGQPNYYHHKQSCAHLLGGHSFTWNDEFCSLKICFVCEVDIWADKWLLTDSVSDVVMGLHRLQTYAYTSSLKLMQYCCLRLD